MVDLDFTVERARVAPYSAAPLLLFDLRVINRTPSVAVENVLLRCQVRIEPTRRRYDETQQERLSELFGSPARWGETLRSFLWTHTNLQIGGFGSELLAELPVPCSCDFNIAATKYFYGLDDGEVPLSMLFSGSIFYRDAEDRLQIDQLSWTADASFRLPVQVWHDMMEHYYPNAAWLCVRRDVFDRLYRYKRQHGLASWERAIEALIEADAAGVRP
jgi:hypothetical protein